MRLSWGLLSASAGTHAFNVRRSSRPPTGLCSLNTGSAHTITLTCSNLPHQRRSRNTCQIEVRAGKESKIAWTAVPSWERSPKDVLRLDVSISESGGWHSNVSVRLCQSIYYGPHRGETAWPPQAPSVHFRSTALVRELKLLREPLSAAPVRELGACYHPQP